MHEEDERPSGVEGQGPATAEAPDLPRRQEDENLLRLKYLQADFENYRKRVEKEARESEEVSLRRFVTGLLRILDELELAVQSARAGNESEFLDGVKMVYKNFSAALEAEGLERIEAVGKKFDPAYHEAVESEPGEEERNVVIAEIRPGYSFRGRVIRPSLVKVGKSAQGESSSVE